jgi:hypothetical protein
MVPSLPYSIPYVPYIYGSVYNAVEGGKGGGDKDDESKDGGPTQGAR